MRTTTRRASVFGATALVVALASGACSEATTDPNSPVAIAFDSLPAPSIVVGDTLRDALTGLVAPLTAQAFNSKGAPIANPNFTYFTRDTTGALRVVDGNLLVAGDTAHDATIPLIASLNGLQLQQKIDIVRRPDSLVQAFDSVPTFTLVVPDDPSNVTPGALTPDTMKVRVVHDSSGVLQPVKSWVVFYDVAYAAPKLADSVRIVAAGTSGTVRSAPPSAVDTTDASGYASRRVRVFAKAGTEVGTRDSVIVNISATYRGVPLAGSPVKVVLRVAR